MKKIIVAIVFVFILAADTFAQTDMLDVNKYFSYFPIKKNEDVTDNDYVWASTGSDYDRFSMLDGKSDEIDTPLEFSLLSYYSLPVVDIRPVQADSILPANNPALADKKLGAAVFQEMQTLRFLGNTAAVGCHEGILKFITDRGNVTRSEIEAYYRSGISALVAQTVDEEFSKTGRNDIVPSQVYALWKARGVSRGTDAMLLIKETLANFFLDPNQTNYERVRGIRARYLATLDVMSLSANDSFTRTIMALSGNTLIDKLVAEVTPSRAEALAKIPSDASFSIFSIPYGGNAR